MVGGDMPASSQPLRLGELLASVSLATNLGTGQPLGHALRTCAIAARLAEAMACGSDEVGEAERAVWRELEKLDQLAPDEFMRTFVQLQLRPGVDTPDPPPGPPPPWMSQRPAGIRALMRTFKTYELDRESLSRFERPVYYALGALSNAHQHRELAERLSRVFAEFTLEVFERRHHFDPPHRIEPERLARSLRAHWERAEASADTH